MANNSHLNDGYFKRMAGFIPGLKKKAAELKQKALVSNIERKAHEPVPCTICGKSFDPFNGFAKPKKTYCERCQSHLDDGYVCLVTMDAKRYAFVKFPAADPKIQKLATGKIFTVTNERMDEVEKTLHPKPENN